VTLINDTITRPTCSTTASPSGSVPNAAISGSERRDPLGTVLFALVLTGLLAALATANVRKARQDH
jgi:hypothetical protein